MPLVRDNCLSKVAIFLWAGPKGYLREGNHLNRYRSELLEISKVLLSQKSSDGVVEHLLRRTLELTGAESGFLVVREEGSYRRRLAVGWEPSERSRAEHRFSRSLVHEAIEARRTVYVPNLAEDPRYRDTQSAEILGRCSLLVAPLAHDGEVRGVLYLECRKRLDAFDAERRDFVEELTEIAALTLLQALEREELRRRNRELEEDLFARYDFRGIVTRDPAMLALLRQVVQVADSDATVLIQGETGTGKELVARALHLNSSRRERPFVVVHCAALPSTLLESELFGHVAGAFTDARKERRGRLAAAHGGTLLLDEVGEIPPPVQAKLLRFLQFGEVQRLGADRTEKVDVRVVAATHRDLPARIEEGKFRQDLYYRLRVIDLRLPPLRERPGDLAALMKYFLKRYWARPGELPRWSPEVERILRDYRFPGNVRELATLVERACLLANGPELGKDLLPPEVVQSAHPPETMAMELTREGLKAAKKVAVARVERRFLRTLLRRCDGNVSQASRESGLHRSYLQRLLAGHRQEGSL